MAEPTDGRRGRASGDLRIGRVPVRRDDVLAVLGVGLVLAAVGTLSLVAAVALAGAFTVAAVLGAYRSFRKHEKQDYRQLEALFSLFQVLPEGAALPPMRGWAASPDFALLVATRLAEHRPERVLECGSGVSTIVAGLTLRRNGRGTLVSLEHDEAWAERTRAMVRRQGLEDVVRVVHAPLASWSVGEEEERWYGTEGLSPDDRFDAVIVDGPPEPPADRHPVLPVLRDRLSPGAVVLVDDAGRAAGSRDLRRWSEEVPGLAIEHVETEEGAAVLRWPEQVPGGRGGPPGEPTAPEPEDRRG